MISIIVSGGKIQAVHSLLQDDVLIIDCDQITTQGAAYVPDHLVTTHPEHVQGRAIVDAMIAFSESDRHAHQH